MLHIPTLHTARLRLASSAPPHPLPLAPVRGRGPGWGGERGSTYKEQRSHRCQTHSTSQPPHALCRICLPLHASALAQRLRARSISGCTRLAPTPRHPHSHRMRHSPRQHTSAKLAGAWAWNQPARWATARNGLCEAS